MEDHDAERVARVELPRARDRLIIWSWHRLPWLFAPVASFRDGATPNGIQEREIYGAHPHQLRAAFRDLQALSQQSLQPNTAGRSWSDAA